VRSLGYSEMFVLSRDDVLAALKDHPEAEVTSLTIHACFIAEHFILDALVFCIPFVYCHMSSLGLMLSHE